MSTSCDCPDLAAPPLHAGTGIPVRHDKASAIEWGGLAVLAIPK